MESIYIKKGRRYIKIGSEMTVDYQPDGLWLHHSYDGGCSHNNISARIRDLPQPVEVENYIKSFLSKEVVINAIQKLNKRGKVYLSEISLDDAAQSIVDEVYLESQKGNDERKST